MKTFAVQSLPAQVENPAPERVVRPSQGRQIEEIVVTATKREESIRDIPSSIQAFSGEQLERDGVVELESIVKKSPGVQFSQALGADFFKVTFRGVESQLRSSDGPQTFGLFLENASLVNPSVGGGLPNVDAFDMQNVEVLKGPQGTLFGGGALAGAVRYVPNKPDTSALSGRVLVGGSKTKFSDDYGSDVGLMVNLPVTETFAVRFAGVQRKTAGYYDDTSKTPPDKDINSSRNLQLRGIAAWKPSEALDLQFIEQRIDLDVADTGYSEMPNTYSRGNTNGKAPVNSFTEVQGGKLNYNFTSFSFASELYRISKDRTQGLQLDRSFMVQSAGETATGILLTDSVANSMEFRFASREKTDVDFGFGLLSGWDWLVGVFEQRTREHLDVKVNAQVGALSSPEDLPGPLSGLGAIIAGLNLPLPDTNTTAIQADLRTPSRERALFFDVTKKLDFGTSRFVDYDFDLNLGGRLFQTRTDPQSVTSYAGIEASNSKQHFEESGFNPKIAATWRLAEPASIYLAASKGFRFGGTNLCTVPVGCPMEAPPNFKSDSLWSYEAGLRTNWFDKRLNADITFFRIDWKDIQIIEQSSNNVDTFTDNAGGAKITGIETSLQTILPFGFSAGIGGSTVKGRTTQDFQSADGPVPAGATLPASAKYTVAANLSHTFEYRNVLMISSISHSYKSSSPADLLKVDTIPSLQTTDLSFNLSAINYRFAPSLRFIASNIFDANKPVGVLESGTNARDYFVSRPRTLSAQFEVAF